MARLLSFVGDGASGATALFVGTVRDHNDRGRVFEIEYESYREMAEGRLAEIEAEMIKKWNLNKVALIHRVGTLRVGEASVAIAVSAPHRKEAFEACRFGIDSVKSRVPIWKKEVMESGAFWASGLPLEDDVL